MGWTDPRTWNVGEIVTKAIMDAAVKMNLRYLKGLDGVPTIESGLIIDNTDGDEYVKLPLLSTAECATVLNVAGEVAYDEATNRIKMYGAALNSVVTTADVDDVPVDAATTDPISSNWAYDFQQKLTTAGDLTYATAAGVWDRLGIGTANQVLKTNAGATAPEWVALASLVSKIKSETRLGNAAAGDVEYTGYGLQPKALLIFALQTYGTSFGICDSALAELCMYSDTVHGVWATGSFIIYQVVTANGNYHRAVVKSLDADGFTLTWSRSVDDIGNTTFIVLALG